MEKRNLLLTHNDMDGYAPELIAMNYLESFSVVHCTNGNMSNMIHESCCGCNKNLYDGIYIVDISCKEDVAEEIEQLPAELKNRIHLFDHHPTAMYLNKYSWANVQEAIGDRKVSASKLFYGYMQEQMPEKENKTLERIVELVSDYDTWEWERLKILDAKTLNRLFVLLEGDKWLESMYQKMQDESTDLISPEEQELLEEDQFKSDKYCDYQLEKAVCKDYTLLGETYSCVICNGGEYMADLFAAMKETHPDADIWMQFFGTAVSMRSQEVDVSKIAQHFGGGGHKHAAGFKVSLEGIMDHLLEV